jgi:hypothetical protein
VLLRAVQCDPVKFMIECRKTAVSSATAAVLELLAKP